MNEKSDNEWLEGFLEEAAEEVPDGPAQRRQTPEAPAHRQLQVIVSDDSLEAHLEAVFPDTTLEEVRHALRQAGVTSGTASAIIDDVAEVIHSRWPRYAAEAGVSERMMREIGARLP